MHSKPMKIIVSLIVIAIAFAAGGYVGKLVFNNDSATGNSSNAAPATSATKLTTVLASPEAYFDQTVTVSGQVYKISDQYYLIEKVQKVSKDNPNSILLDTSQSKIDLSQYANAGSSQNATPSQSSTPPKIKPAITVTGKITADSKTHQPELVISSIKP